MTEAKALLTELRRIGARVRAKDHDLVIDVPGGALSDELQARLRRQKTELLAELETPRTWPCVSCRSEWFVFGDPGVVCYWCRKRQNEGAGRA